MPFQHGKAAYPPEIGDTRREGLGHGDENSRSKKINRLEVCINTKMLCPLGYTLGILLEALW